MGKISWFCVVNENKPNTLIYTNSYIRVHISCVKYHTTCWCDLDHINITNKR